MTLPRPPTTTAQEARRLTGVAPKVWERLPALERLKRGHEATAILARRAKEAAVVSQAVDETIG